jgi:LAO/AO transport system kinase
MTVDALLDALDRGEIAALARAISMVENQREGYEDLLGRVHARVGRARRIGVTGPPGAGKSTLTERLVQEFRRQGRRVAVIAVDPTSPFTGGALLGDRIRMESVSLDPDVFIRSMATRGSVGGLATTTEEVADVLDAFGFDCIIIETVGVGQTELDVARTAQTTILTLVPESGDGIQTLKAGLMEAADLYVINKSDRPGADRLKAEVEIMLGMRRGNAFRNIPAHHHPSRPAGPTMKPSDGTRSRGDGSSDAWEPPVLMTVATRGEGMAELMTALEAHRAYLERSGAASAWRRGRLAERTRAVVNRGLAQWLWEETRAEELLAERLASVAAGSRNPYDVAAEILDQVRSGAGKTSEAP